MSTWPTLPEPNRRPAATWTQDVEMAYALAARAVILPPFQREWAWSAERVCEYLQGLFEDLPQTPLALWRPSHHGPHIVLDGQHRLAALGADVPGRSCPAVRFDVLTLRWEPGEADGVMTLAPSTVIGRSLLDPWGSLTTKEERDYATHVALIKQRHRSARVPIIERRGEATPAAWRDAYAYFERLNRSVPFTGEELAAFRDFALKETP